MLYLQSTNQFIKHTMKSKVLAALKTKFEGVQDAILGAFANKMIADGTIKTEEDVTTAVAGVTFDRLCTWYGDSRADQAEKTTKRKLEAMYKNNEQGDGAAGSSAQNKGAAANAGNGGSEDVPAWAKEFMETVTSKFTAFEERQNAMEKGRVTESRRSQFEAVVSKLPESYRKAYSRTPIDTQTDDEFTAMLADITNEAAEIARADRAAGATFGRPLGNGRQVSASNSSGKTEATDAEVDAVIGQLGI